MTKIKLNFGYILITKKLQFDLIKKDNCPKVNFHLISKILKRK